MVRHPIAVFGLAITTALVLVVGDNGPRDAFEVISTGPTFYYGVFVFFAANLVASRDRRSHSGELLAVTPSPSTDRVAALCVGALVPALLSAAFVVAVHTANLARDLYVVVPTGWHLAQAPLTVLGGALLGVMVARLTSVPGVALLVMVAMVLADAWLAGKPDTLQPLATYVAGAEYGDGPGWHGHHPGSVAWHVVYVAALCAMAAAGAFLREARSTGRVLVVGGALTALAVAAGLAALP